MESTCRLCFKLTVEHLEKINETITSRYELVFSHPLRKSEFEFICVPCSEDLKRCSVFVKRVRDSEVKFFSTMKLTETMETENQKQRINEILASYAEKESHPSSRKPYNEVKCPDCGKLTRNIVQHRVTHFPKPSIDSNTCTICNQAFVDLPQHIKQRHERTTVCNICNRVVHDRMYAVHQLRHRDPPIYTEEEKTTFKKFYCEMCNTFVQKLSYHKQIVHVGDALICEVCGAGPLNQVTYYQHKRNHERGMFECDLCAKKFAIKLRLRRHMENIHATKKLVCSLCGMKFGNVQGLGKHIEKVHVEKTVKCDYCELKFKTIYMKKSHERAIHLKDINLPCDECGAIFHSTSALYVHKTKGHDVVFRCFCEMGKKCEPSKTSKNLENQKKFFSKSELLVFDFFFGNFKRAPACFDPN